jgi:molybdate transport system substrate-binding protein
MTAPLTVLSTLAVMGVLEEILPSYGVGAVKASYGPTRDLLVKIAAGDTADVTILTDIAIDNLIATGVLAESSRVDLVRSYIGVAVKSGAPQPDITTEDAFRTMLLDVKSIVYSAAGASGLVFVDLIQRLGVAEVVNAKATVIPNGLTGELAADGRAEIAIQQVSELMVVPGIDIVGRLPEALHAGAVFSGGIFPGAAAGAAALLNYLASPAMRDVFIRHGVEPI